MCFRRLRENAWVATSTGVSADTSAVVSADDTQGNPRSLLLGAMEVSHSISTKQTQQKLFQAL